MNLQPTRNNHVLNIFLTNCPALIFDIKVIPGISDHEALCVESALTVKSVSPSKKETLFVEQSRFCIYQSLSNRIFQHLS